MREITTHKVNGLNDAIQIRAVDEPGSGGANHIYVIRVGVKPDHRDQSGYYSDEQTIQFQNGPIADAGFNGISNEALLAIVQDRLECFEKGQFACVESAYALHAVKEAAAHLKMRTESRVRRGVEGTSAK